MEYNISQYCHILQCKLIFWAYCMTRVHLPHMLASPWCYFNPYALNHDLNTLTLYSYLYLLHSYIETVPRNAKKFVWLWVRLIRVWKINILERFLKCQKRRVKRQRNITINLLKRLLKWHMRHASDSIFKESVLPDSTELSGRLKRLQIILII